MTHLNTPAAGGENSASPAAGRRTRALSDRRGRPARMNQSISEFEPCHGPFTADDITWHRPRPSYDPSSRSLSYRELCTVTDCEAVLETLTNTEVAGWICDLIAGRKALEVS